MDANSQNRWDPEDGGDQPVFCDRCLRVLEPGRGELYVVRIEALADPTPPEFDLEDLRRDHRQEWQQLVEAMRDLSPREAMDQVHRRLTITLCTACYREWIENPAG